MTRQAVSEVNEFGETKGEGQLVLEAFEWLRLRRLPVRNLLQRLAGPLLRLHAYRNTRTRYLRHALCELDCAESPAGSVNPACQSCTSG